MWRTLQITWSILWRCLELVIVVYVLSQINRPQHEPNRGRARPRLRGGAHRATEPSCGTAAGSGRDLTASSTISNAFGIRA
jgi:hypothetical protein